MSKDQFLYMKVYEDLKNKIEKGELAPGSRMQSNEELCRSYEVSAITVKRAMQMLVGENLIRRIPRKGSFVTEESDRQKKSSEPYGADGYRSFSEKNQNLIGVILEYAMPSFGINLMFELDKAIKAQGYRMLLRFSYADRDREIEEIEFLMSMGIQGLIILPCHGFYYNTLLLKLVFEGFPVVVLDKKMEGIQVPCIRTDNTDAVFRLVDYLYEKGERRIGMITVDDAGTITLKERKKAFRERISQLNLPVLEECVLPQTSYGIIKREPIEDYVIRIASYLKRCGHHLDAVICMEFGNLLAYIEAAKRVEGGTSNIRACCIDGIYFVPGGSDYVHIEQNETALANRAMEVLWEQMEGKTVEQGEIKIPGILRT